MAACCAIWVLVNTPPHTRNSCKDKDKDKDKELKYKEAMRGQINIEDPEGLHLDSSFIISFRRSHLVLGLQTVTIFPVMTKCIERGVCIK